eukprot:scaffold1241_cov227-Pinguiococcus_pyrenoidosus.AAC.1
MSSCRHRTAHEADLALELPILLHVVAQAALLQHEVARLPVGRSAAAATSGLLGEPAALGGRPAEADGERRLPAGEHADGVVVALPRDGRVVDVRHGRAHLDAGLRLVAGLDDRPVSRSLQHHAQRLLALEDHLVELRWQLARPLQQWVGLLAAAVGDDLAEHVDPLHGIGGLRTLQVQHLIAGHQLERQVLELGLEHRARRRDGQRQRRRHVLLVLELQHAGLREHVVHGRPAGVAATLGRPRVESALEHRQALGLAQVGRLLLHVVQLDHHGADGVAPLVDGVGLVGAEHELVAARGDSQNAPRGVHGHLALPRQRQRALDLEGVQVVAVVRDVVPVQHDELAAPAAQHAGLLPQQVASHDVREALDAAMDGGEPLVALSRAVRHEVQALGLERRVQADAAHAKVLSEQLCAGVHREQQVSLGRGRGLVADIRLRQLEEPFLARLVK